MATSILGVRQSIMDKKNGSVSFMADAPRWVIVVLGLAYATGFLIVSTFLNSFGVQNAGGDLLRLKYLQVGFYFLLFFGSVVVLTISMKKGHELQLSAIEDSTPRKGGLGADENDPSSSPDPAIPQSTLQGATGGAEYASRMIPQRIGVWINVLASIYLAVGFAPPKDAPRVLPAVTVLLFVAILGSAKIHSIGKKYTKDNKDLHRLIYALWWILLIVLVPLDLWVIWPFRSRLWSLLRGEWLVLMVFSALLGVLWYVAYRGSDRRPERSEEEHKVYMWSRVSIGLAIYYLCVLSFAHGVYPFMSAAKGGGYYPDASLVRLTLRKESGRCPDEFLVQGAVCQSNELVLIEENSGAVFIANPKSPDRSGEPSGVMCWTDAACRPKVVEIKLPEVLYLEHLAKRVEDN